MPLIGAVQTTGSTGGFDYGLCDLVKDLDSRSAAKRSYNNRLMRNGKESRMEMLI